MSSKQNTQLKREQLHGYQLKAVQHILDNPKSGLFLDMGLGKTASTLTAVADLFKELQAVKVLVIGTKRIAESVWGAEALKWEHLSHLRVVKIKGTQKQRVALLDRPGDVYTISRDNVAWLCQHFKFGAMPFDVLVIDESSSFKNPKSMRFKALRKCIMYFNRVVLLTGTPAPNGLIDLWAQIYLLDNGERLGRFITDFRSKYFYPGATNGHIVYNYKLKDQGEQAIYKQIGDICLSMKTGDYLKDLPDKRVVFIEVALNDKNRRQYIELEKEAVLEIEGEEISAANVLALNMKLSQLANGAVYTSEDKQILEVHDSKLEALEDLVEEAQGKPVLVSYEFISDKERILKRFKGSRTLETDKDIQDWNSGKIPMLVTHPASAGHGLNLQKGGNIIVHFSVPWSLELYEQFNARLHRQGQDQAVFVYHLIVRKSIDDAKRKALESKAMTQNDLMEALKAKIAEY